MSYTEKTRGLYQAQLAEIKSAGIFKEERFIHSAQAADIEVEFPAGSDLKRSLTCARTTTWAFQATRR